jgi:hypothetical protein
MPSLAIFLAAIPAMAQSGAGDYLFLLASGFLCDVGDSSACPGVVKSAQGDSYEMSGAGTFSTQGKSVTATGTFTHKSRDGNTLETGVWIASELVSFESYGIAPGALMQMGRAFGPAMFGPGRFPMLNGPVSAGGLAVFRIRLVPMRGFPKTALLQVNCALGKVPAEHQREGIRLAFEGGGGEFDEELGGRVLFLSTMPTAAATKPPAPRPNTNPPPPQ